MSDHPLIEHQIIPDKIIDIIYSKKLENNNLNFDVLHINLGFFNGSCYRKRI